MTEEANQGSTDSIAVWELVSVHGGWSWWVRHRSLYLGKVIQDALQIFHRVCSDGVVISILKIQNGSGGDLWLETIMVEQHVVHTINDLNSLGHVLASEMEDGNNGDGGQVKGQGISAHNRSHLVVGEHQANGDDSVIDLHMKFSWVHQGSYISSKSVFQSTNSSICYNLLLDAANHAEIT
eukprot:g40165.t1